MYSDVPQGRLAVSNIHDGTDSLEVVCICFLVIQYLHVPQGRLAVSNIHYVS